MNKSTLHKIFPSRSIAILMLIGFADLFMTAILHAQGSITELNPLMKPLIEQSEWLFGFVKAMTLVLAWIVLARYCSVNKTFVRHASMAGSFAYLTIWTGWVLAANVSV